MKSALILQGWYQKPESNWYPWLKTELEKIGYEVFLPDLPTIHTEEPNLKEMMSYIDDEFVFDNQTVVIGHSLGCLLGMRLAEKHMFDMLILVAGWDFNDLTPQHQLFWKEPIDHETITTHVSEIHCISSDNDPYFTKITVEEMAGRLGGMFHLIPGAGHFTEEYGINQIPELLSLLNDKAEN
jgi:predicted alpha/beta hydrolase family esterase